MAMKKRFHKSAMQPKEHYGDRLEYLGEDMYAGLDNRRALERRDSGMINEDKHAVANLPQQVMYKPWPKARHYVDYGLDDTIRGIDHQQNLDNEKMEKHLQPEKY